MGKIKMALALLFLIGSTSLGIVLLGQELPQWNNSGGSLMDGTLTRSFEDGLSDGDGIGQTLGGIYGYLRFTLFGQGYDGVLAAKNQMLYTTEEYDPTLVSSSIDLATIASVAETLESRDLHLLVVLIPSKARVHPSPRFPLPPPVAGKYDAILRWAQEEAIDVLDLLSPMARETASTPELLFHRGDSHWNQRGAQLAARVIDQHLDRQAIHWGEYSWEFRLEYGDQQYFTGDLSEYINPKVEWVPNLWSQIPYQPVEALLTRGPSWGLFDLPTIPVLLVGTSYSAEPRWGFEAFLKESLGLDVLNLAQEGKGPLGPMEDYLASEEYDQLGSTLVIWEIPERYIRLEVELD